MKIRSIAFNNALKNEISSRRRKTKRIQSEREDEIYSRFPAVHELDAAIKEMAFDIGRQIVNNGVRSDIEKAQRAIDEKLDLRNKILVENGYSADYLDLQYVCSECRDTGRVGGELCRCIIQLAIDTTFESCGIRRDQTFEAFDLSLQATEKDRAAMSRIFEQARAYADAFPNNDKRDMLYFGLPGVGKTYLLNCIGARVLERGYSVLKINAHRLIQLTMDTLRATPEERPDFLLPDLLIIDDLGTEPMIPNITIETLLSILCQRQDMSKPTLFATNLEVASNDQHTATIQTVYGQRFASRLMAPSTVKIQAVRTGNVRLTAH